AGYCSGGGAPGPVGCSLPAALEAGCPLRVRRHAVPAAEESRATGHLPAASGPGSSLRAVPPGGGLLQAGLEPRDLQAPTPRYRQPGKTRTAADRTCGRAGATAAPRQEEATRSSSGFPALSTREMGRPTLDWFDLFGSMPRARQIVASRSGTETGRCSMASPPALVFTMTCAPLVPPPHASADQHAWERPAPRSTLMSALRPNSLISR